MIPSFSYYKIHPTYTFFLREDIARNRQCHLQKRHLQNSHTSALQQKNYSHLLLLTVLIASPATNPPDELFGLKKKVKKELLSCLILSFQISQLYSWTIMLVGKCDDDKLPYCPQFFWGAMFTQTVWQQQQQLLHRKKLQTCREQAQPALNIGSPGSPATDSRLMIWTFQPVPRVSKTKFFWRHLSRLDNV